MNSVTQDLKNRVIPPPPPPKKPKTSAETQRRYRVNVQRRLRTLDKIMALIDELRSEMGGDA